MEKEIYMRFITADGIKSDLIKRASPPGMKAHNALTFTQRGYDFANEEELAIVPLVSREYRIKGIKTIEVYEYEEVK